VALVAALAGAACSEGPERTLGDAGLMRLGGGPAFAHAGNLCDFLDLSTANPNNTFGTTTAALVQLRSNRARFEMIGDAAPHSIGEPLGTCAAPPSDLTAPTVVFSRGHATVTQVAKVGGAETVVLDAEFGPLLFPGNAAEPGVVVGNDVNAGGRNVLEIIWPGLAGTGPAGSQPIVRVQMASPPRTWSATAPYTVKIVWNMDAAATDDPSHVMHLAGMVTGIPLDGSNVLPGGPAVIGACPSPLLGPTRGNATEPIVDPFISLVQNRAPKRLRFEATGDAVGDIVRLLGPCAATDAPTVFFTGGEAYITATDPRRGTVWEISKGRLFFDQPLLFPGAAVEPGVVVTQDANRNVLEIIWPQLAGGPPGAPIFRVQLADFQNASRVSSGYRLHFEAHFYAKADPPEAPKTFVVSKDLLLP
jgi:hypothetical protein